LIRSPSSSPAEFAGPREAWEAGISTTFQEINLQPFLSVAQNLHLGREPTRRFGFVDVRRMNRDAAELLARYGISIDVRKPLGSVGVAIQQMIAIVRAVSTDAKVVILDEPTSSLEPNEVEQLFRVIRILRDDNVALLQLVATMLGRDAREVRTTGKTAFSIEGRKPGSEPVLSVSGLTRFRLLNDVSLDVSAGEVVGLAGLLGSGRTETVESIFGLIDLDSGTVTMNGTPVKAGSPTTSVQRGIGLLPEDRNADGIVPTMSVKDNITLAANRSVAKWGFVSRARVNKLVDHYVERLQIKVADVNQSVAELSGGNQQKVLLARLLCFEPKVVLLDEPTRGIDVGAKAEIQGLIDELALDGLAVILISSELEDVVEGSNRVLVLKDGAVVGVLVGDEISEESVMDVIADVKVDSAVST
jgi:ribose transport system ATP-binding protein